MPDNMSKEIREQPEVMERVLENGWAEVLAAARDLRINGLHSVTIAARGTTDNSALYAKYLFEVLLGVPTALASPSTFTLNESQINLKDVLVIGISESGGSKDILETVRRSARRDARTLTLTNDEDSSMAEAGDKHLFLWAGNEESVAATKTYTAELLVLYLLVSALRGEESRNGEAWWVPDLASKALEASWTGTERYRYAERLVTTSRDYNFATAQEAALKLMETSYVAAQALSAADLKHGPMAMIGQDFPVLAIVTPGKVRDSKRETVEALAERGADTVVVGEDEELIRRAPCGFLVPGSYPEELSPLLYVLPVQIFAHDLRHLKQLDPDAPRGLSKVTETW